MPVTPPAILALPPAVAVPLAHPPPTPVVPLADDAPGTASPIQNGVRVTFGPDRADMTAKTAAALTTFAEGLLSQNSTSINIFAYAAGNADDPSTPRRLSLQRALAARAVLMQAGIPSPRIYPRALGPAGGEEPDRVDVVTGTSTPPAAGHAG
jgi:outer membrane protein OmpA-like peptidoglycan-associated protein